MKNRINKAAKENGIEFPEFSISEVADNLYNRSLIYKYRDDLVQKDKERSMIYRMAKFGKFEDTIEAEDVVDETPIYTLENAAID